MSDFFYHHAFLEVNLDLLKKNCEALQALSPHSFFCPMIKANAYGHGSVSVAKSLLACNVKQVGVITSLEAKALREQLKSSFDILIFGPLLDEQSVEVVVKSGFIPVCNNWKDLRALAKKKKELRIHLKFDTGFSRLGFPLCDAERIKIFLENNPCLKLQALCTHLIEGRNIVNSESYSCKQLEKLKNLRSLFPFAFLHVFNTESLFISSIYQIDNAIGSRPGIGLYGIKPSFSDLKPEEQKRYNAISLQPTSTLKCYVTNIHHLQKGDRVSYSGIWEALKPSTLATVSIGYGDAFSRSWADQGEVLLRGKRVPVVARMCMDFFMIDVSVLEKESPIELKEEVVLFGEQEGHFLSVEEHAKKMKTLPYELFVNLGNRVQRKYRGAYV